METVPANQSQTVTQAQKNVSIPSPSKTRIVLVLTGVIAIVGVVGTGFLFMKNQSLFIEFLGNTPIIRVLDFLLTEQELDFSLTDLAEQCGVGRTTLYRIWDRLLTYHIVIPTRIIGKAKLYKLNTKNAGIQKLIELDNLLVKQDLRRRAGKTKLLLHA